MNTKKTMQKTLEEKVDACMMLLRSVVAEQNRWKPVLEWQLKKASQRSRQEKCRGTKNNAAMVRREHTIQNNPRHALHWSLFEIGGTNPRVGEGMMTFLKNKLGAGDPTSWFRMMAALDAKRAVVFLVSLYNSSFWVPWVTPSSACKMKMFLGWVDKDEKQIARHTFPVIGDIVMKDEPPVGQWTDKACNKFCGAAIWKVYGVIWAFLKQQMPKIDSDDPDLEQFHSLVHLMCSFSDYKPDGKVEWDPTMLNGLDRSDATRIYRLVAPRLKILKTAFLEGLTCDINTFFNNSV